MQAREERRGVGLSNVRARLEQIYGNAYDFEAANAPGGGFGVTLSLPFEPGPNAPNGGGAL
jgi:sensor histidine kinase YesM